jgi:hypothetical protein
MIQRIQTVYLLLAVLAFTTGAVLSAGELLACLVQGVLAAMSVGIVFLYKQRPTQAMCCVLAMGVVVAFYILLAVRQPLLNWYAALPLVGTILLFLARKAILKDEKLVRSLDRIR